MFKDDIQTEWLTDTYRVVKTIKYPHSSASINELSKCVVSGSGKRVSVKVLEDREIEILDLIYNFKVCTLDQINRFLNIKGYSIQNIENHINFIIKQYGIMNIMEYTYTDFKTNNEIREKVVTITGQGIHLVRNYCNREINENLATFNKRRLASIKRLSYSYRFIQRTKPVIDLYLDLLEHNNSEINLYDFRLKIADKSGEFGTITADLLLNYNSNSNASNLLIRGIGEMERYTIDNEYDLSFFVKYTKSFNMFIEDKNSLNFHLPISNSKPRLLLVSYSKEMIDTIKSILSKEEVPLDFIDILHYSELKEYLDNLFIKDECESSVNELRNTYIDDKIIDGLYRGEVIEIYKDIFGNIEKVLLKTKQGDIFVLPKSEISTRVYATIKEGNKFDFIILYDNVVSIKKTLQLRQEKVLKILDSVNGASGVITDIFSWGANVSIHGYSCIMRNSDFSLDHTSIGSIYKKGEIIKELRFVTITESGTILLRPDQKYKSFTHFDDALVKEGTYIFGVVKTINDKKDNEEQCVLVETSGDYTMLSPNPTFEIKENDRVVCKVEQTDSITRTLQGRIVKIKPNNL